MLTRRRVVRGCSVLSALFATTCGGTPPAPVTTNPPHVAPRPELPAVSIAWSFESGLDGWRLERGTAQPVCGDVPAERLRGPSGQGPVTLNPPGDYWRTMIDVGQAGRCRIDTGAPGRRDTALTSPDFTIAARYLAFRIGGGGTAGTRLKLELREADGRQYRLEREDKGPGGLAMERKTWDLATLQGQVARLVLSDDGRSGAPLLVDDVRDSDTRANDEPAPVWGFADLHAHPVAQLGFGRHFFFGENDGDPAQALGSCADEHGKDVVTDFGKAGPLIKLAEDSPARLAGHRTSGNPSFSGWPLWSTMIHQQMYVRWIERAHRGGLRLMVALAVHNEQLANSFNGKGDTTDMAVAKAQLAAMKELVGRHSSFMAIANSSREARQIIASGRLAVVLGVEVDAIGGCRRDTDCTVETARGAIDDLYRFGARHVFPIHLADNAFGGAAVFKDGVFNLLTWWLRDEYQSVMHDESVAFAYTPDDQALPVLFAKISQMPNRYGKKPYRPPFGEYKKVKPGHVNALGLSQGLGVAVIEHMIRKGIVIDVDHMSERASNETIALAAARGAPVAMGHAWFRDLGYEKKETSDSEKRKHERMKPADEVLRVTSAGGVVAPIANQRDIRRAAASGVLTECAGSSASWLQAYAYVVDRTAQPIGIGTDFNGLAQEPLPRFGTFACLARTKHGGGVDKERTAHLKTMSATIRDDADAQRAGVTYATPLRDARKYRFAGPIHHAPYSPEERTIWIGIAAWKAQADPAHLELDANERTVVRDIQAGFSDTTEPTGTGYRRAAFLVHTGAPVPATPAGLKTRFLKIRAIWQRWWEMETGNRDAPLERDTLGDRDFDYNLDGLAHYGLLPDMFQDVANQLRADGGTVNDLSAWDPLESTCRHASLSIL